MAAVSSVAGATACRRHVHGMVAVRYGSRAHLMLLHVALFIVCHMLMIVFHRTTLSKNADTMLH